MRAIQDRFDDLIAWARWSVWWERLWPQVWRIVGLICVFLTVSWLGLWRDIPPSVRICGVLIFGILLGYALWTTITVRRPNRAGALARLDLDSGLPNNPASSLDDELDLGKTDSGSRTLWLLHRRQMAANVAAMTFSAPSPGMPRQDRYAIRAFALLAAIASAFFAGDERSQRLMSAFDWTGSTSQETIASVSGWIDPPLYTRLPPVALDFSGKTRTIRAPIGSTVIVRMQNGGMSISAESGLAPTDTQQSAGPGAESRFTLRETARLKIHTGFFSSTSLRIEAIPDLPPTISFVGDPKFDRKGGFSLSYRSKDDYGVSSVHSIIVKGSAFPGKRTLMPPPDIAFALPMAGSQEQVIASTTDVSAHGWAGAPIELTLVARDDIGQEGRSEPLSFTLPQRLFANPLARALAEQRRNLIIDPDNAKRVQIALDAFLIAPEYFSEDSGLYLGLNDIAETLRKARSDQDLLAVGEALWALAVEIDEGRLNDSKRELLAAQERLRDAIERGASEEEIKRLTREYQEAMQRYLRDFARQNRDNRKQGQENTQNDSSRTITSSELNDMLKQLEDAMKRGDTAEAERLLEELGNILNNLQMGEPGENGDSLAGDMNRSMKNLNDLLRDQQQLHDDTYKEGMQDDQGEMEDEGEGEDGMPSENRQGETGQGKDGSKQGQGRSLTERQQELRERLQELQRGMKGQGLQEGQGFSDAERAMRDAERALRENEHGEAAEAQKRALQGLQRGARDMAQQMRDLLGDNRPPQQADQKDKSPSGAANNPFSGPSQGIDNKDSKGNAAVRARRIIEELRRKLGEPERRQEELDYFKRLLPPN